MDRGFQTPEGLLSKKSDPDTASVTIKTGAFTYKVAQRKHPRLGYNNGGALLHGGQIIELLSKGDYIRWVCVLAPRAAHEWSGETKSFL